MAIPVSRKIKLIFNPTAIVILIIFILFAALLVFNTQVFKSNDSVKKEATQEQCQVQWTGAETAGHGDWMSREDAQNWVDNANSMSDSNLHHSLYCTEIK